MDQKWYLGLIKAILAQQQSSGFEYCRLQTWFKHKEGTSWKKLESRANFSYQRNYCCELCTIPVADGSTKLWVVRARWGESTQALFLLCIRNIWLSLPVFVTCQLNYCKNMFSCFTWGFQTSWNIWSSDAAANICTPRAQEHSQHQSLLVTLVNPSLPCPSHPKNSAAIAIRNMF